MEKPWIHLGKGFFAALLLFQSAVGFSLPAKPAPPVLTAHLDHQVLVAWSPVPGATSYTLYRSQGSGPWSAVAKVDHSAFFEDVPLEAGTPYSYQVSVTDQTGEGPRSQPSSVVTKAAPVYGLKATPGDGQMALTWQPSPGAREYWITRYTLDGFDPAVRIRVGPSPQTPSYHDQRLKNGTLYFYQVTPVNEAGETAEVVSIVNASPTGPAAPRPQNRPRTWEAPQRPVVSLTTGNRLVSLSWDTKGSRWAVSRQTDNDEPRLLNSDIVGRVFTDPDVENGKTYCYRVKALGIDADSPWSEPVSGTPTGKPAESWSGTLDYGLAGEPVQSGRFLLPDIHSPVRGTLLVNRIDISRLPQLVSVAKKFNLAVLEVSAFNFGSKENPREIVYEPIRLLPLCVLDDRWPELSARRVLAALDSAVRKFPQHPEIATAGLVFYGFSATVWGNAGAISQPALSQRVLAVIDMANLQQRTMDVMDSIPHLFVASGEKDWWSSLNMRMTEVPRDVLILANIFLPDSPTATYSSYTRWLATRRGAPVTTVNNIGAGHGDNVDNQFVSVWLADVLGQRLPFQAAGSETVRLPGWNGVSGYAGTYDLDIKGRTPWDWFLNPSVRQSNLVIAPMETYRDPRAYLWLPSRNTAEAWKRYAETGGFEPRP